jgi:hypothetical protein
VCGFNQLESLLEDGRIKLSDWVSDLLGVSCRRMLRALAAAETDPAKLVALADPTLRATNAQRQDLRAAATLSTLHREILGLFLARLDLIEGQIATVDRNIAAALQDYQDAVQRWPSFLATASTPHTK